jgi:hypothetical protein
VVDPERDAIDGWLRGLAGQRALRRHGHAATNGDPDARANGDPDARANGHTYARENGNPDARANGHTYARANGHTYARGDGNPDARDPATGWWSRQRRLRDGCTIALDRSR